MSGGFYNPNLTPKAQHIMATMQKVATQLQQHKGMPPNPTTLREVAVLIEEASGTPDLDIRHPQIRGMVAAWNQILWDCCLRQLGDKPYTNLIDRVFAEPESKEVSDPG